MTCRWHTGVVLVNPVRAAPDARHGAETWASYIPWSTLFAINHPQTKFDRKAVARLKKRKPGDLAKAISHADLKKSLGL